MKEDVYCSTDLEVFDREVQFKTGESVLHISKEVFEVYTVPMLLLKKIADEGHFILFAQFGDKIGNLHEEMLRHWYNVSLGQINNREEPVETIVPALEDLLSKRVFILDPNPSVELIKETLTSDGKPEILCLIDDGRYGDNNEKNVLKKENLENICTLAKEEGITVICSKIYEEDGFYDLLDIFDVIMLPRGGRQRKSDGSNIEIQDWSVLCVRK